MTTFNRPLTHHLSGAIGKPNATEPASHAGLLRPVRMRRQRCGQVLLEFAISLVGLIMLTYVVLNVWTWMTIPIVQRQDAFQRSRLAAGSSNPGKPVQYRPPLLSLVGPPGSRGGQNLPPDIFDVPCTAAQPLYDQAKALLDEVNRSGGLIEQRDAENAEAQRLAGVIRGLVQDMQVNCANNGEACYNFFLDIIHQKKRRMQEHADNAQALTERIKTNYDEAMRLIQEGRALCDAQAQSSAATH